MRELSPKMLTDLQTGILHPFLDSVKSNNTLDFQIRNKNFNIYYRGGSLIRVSELKGNYYLKFETKYLANPILPAYLPISSTSDYKNVLISTQKDAQDWVTSFPYLKDQMDLWFGKHPKNEREFQQVVARENNYSRISKSTDYFILDIEYAKSTDIGTTRTSARFDLVACKWLSSGSARKKTTNLGLSFIEMKFGDGAFSGKAGLIDHIKDILSFLKESSFLPSIKNEMTDVFNQKLDLGLINNQKKISSFGDNKPEYIFLLANHDPDSSRLINELNKLNASPLLDEFSKYADLKFSTANFHGYGLFQEGIYNLQEFMTKFKDQIG